MTIEKFSSFYDTYMGTRALSRTNFTALSHYAEQKYLFMASQVDSRGYSITHSQFPVENCVKMNPKFLMYIYGPFSIFITYNGNIFIENPRAVRRDAFINGQFLEYKRCTYADRDSSYNEDYIVTNCGHIVFRDKHDEFYNLQYEGKTWDAVEYALRVLGVKA
jgi:hypothetical protein